MGARVAREPRNHEVFATGNVGDVVHGHDSAIIGRAVAHRRFVNVELHPHAGGNSAAESLQQRSEHDALALLPNDIDHDQTRDRGVLGAYESECGVVTLMVYPLFDGGRIADSAHERYKDLSEVEWAFRTMKTVLLQMRGIFVRKANRTRAHVFIIMLAYLLVYELRRLWRDVEMTVEGGLKNLATLCATEVLIGNVSVQTIPEPRSSVRELLSKADVTLPETIPSRGARVVTRKKLVPERRSA